VDAKIFNTLLDVIMTIQVEWLFEGIHDKCRVMLNDLIPCMEERCMDSDLFLLKHVESLVKEMNSSKEINLYIEVHLLTNIVESKLTGYSSWVHICNIYVVFNDGKFPCL